MRPVRGQRKSAAGSNHNIALVTFILFSKRREARDLKFNSLLKESSMKSKKMKPKYAIFDVRKYQSTPD